MGNTKGGPAVISPHLAEQLDQIVTYVRDYGRVALHVYGDDEPPFTYSIGFPVSVNHPEVIVVGLTQELMQFMIDELWRQISEEGLRLQDSSRIGGLLEGFDCIAREITDIDAIDEYFRVAVNYHQTQRGNEIDRAFQIVWPDHEEGLFPWDAGCPPEVIDYQPALYRKSLNA